MLKGRHADRPVLYVWVESTHAHALIHYYIASLYLPLFMQMISPTSSIFWGFLNIWMSNSEEVTKPRICSGYKKDKSTFILALDALAVHIRVQNSVAIHLSSSCVCIACLLAILIPNHRCTYTPRECWRYRLYAVKTPVWCLSFMNIDSSLFWLTRCTVCTSVEMGFSEAGQSSIW